MYSDIVLRTLPCYHCVHCSDQRKLKYNRFTERKCKLTNRWGSMNRAFYCNKFENTQIESSDYRYNGFLVRKDQIEDYRTERQWSESGFIVKPGEVGTEMYATRDAGIHNSKRFIYFLPEQVKKTNNY